MTAVDLYPALVWSARLSAGLFTAALLAPLALGRRTVAPFPAFVGAHTVHFGLVIAVAAETGGAGMFPGGRSLAEVGGWPTLLAIVALFYLLALASFLERRPGGAPSLAVRRLGRFSTGFLAFMFVATYLPLAARSPWYGLFAAVIFAAAALDLAAPRLRSVRCLHAS